MKKIWVALAAAVMALGMAVTTSVPAQAATYSATRYCDWPRRAVIKVTPPSSSSFVTVVAYSPSGYRLGSNGWRGTYTWWTPWEDVRFSIDSPSGSSISTSCF